MTEPEDQTEIASSQSLRKLVKTFRLDSLVGQTLEDRYIIDDLIGEGAMGAVFRARQIRLRRTVALKIPKPEYCQKPDFLLRFEREALTMAQLVHQNTVQIFDVFVSDDPAEPSFIAMEYVEGIELDKFLNDQQNDLTIEAVLHLFRQIAEALNAAHLHGIVHRDIKPSNIIVTMPQRIAKVMDFGIAKLDLEDAYQTSGAHAIGTPAYMAPEQIQGKKITPAADVYAFSVMIYRLLSRHAPFDAKNTTGLIFAHVNETPVPVLKRNAHLPEALNAVLRRGMSKKPEERPGSATELVNEVAKALQPMAKKCYADLFIVEPNVAAEETLPAESEASAQAFESGKLAAAQTSAFNWRMAMLGVIFLSLGFVLTVLGIRMLHKGQEKNGSTPPHEQLVANVPSLPGTNPDQPASTPEAVDFETPVAEPETSAVTPSPDQSLPQSVIVATSTPAPSPTPSPEPLPTPSPEPDNAVFNSRWDPKANPPQISEFRRKSLLEEIDQYMSDHVQTPCYRGEFTPKENDLAKLGGPAANLIIGRLKIFRVRFEEVAIYFRIRADDSTVWNDHALVLFDIRIVGRPARSPDPRFRKTLQQSRNPVEAHLERHDDGKWELVGLERYTEE